MDEVDFILIDEVRILFIIFGFGDKLIYLYLDVNIFVLILKLDDYELEEKDKVVFLIVLGI